MDKAEINKTWYWIDTFLDEDIEKFKDEVDNYDFKACYINEENAVGISVWSDTGDVTLDDSYNKFLENLQNSKYYEHRKIYEELKEKNKLQLENTYMLGTTIIGTKEELKKLIGNPHIKASSIGIVIDKF
ncbi:MULTISPECIES: anti sigma factor C-terminal domain-containing protein [unclassified Clostridium]|uniref:anti sigma factor C-terminal domain-containing protein n=1 Tax=unclassified Clostridium TaxID=2614128 RepID=UPI000EC1EE5A|nr:MULTISPECIES: anti sigma factor C-terminal domain-containing protein [unclassified Clostridium]HCQ89161.1 hypothetical protein [Clostridium sp.]